MAKGTKLLEKKFDVLYRERLRNKDRILHASRRIDLLREILAKKIKHSNGVATIRKWREKR